jgi:hypothetical protein
MNHIDRQEKIKTCGNTGFASGGVMCLVNIDKRALCFYQILCLSRQYSSLKSATFNSPKPLL